MQKGGFLRFTLALLLASCLGRPLVALTINPQYPAGILFSAADDATAKAAINAAAADLSAAVTSSLNGVASDLFSGTFGSATANLGFQFNYRDPETGATTVRSNATVQADVVSIVVGTRTLGSTNLGEGGTASVSIDAGQSNGHGSMDPRDANQWLTAVTLASAKAESAYRRGGGPIVGTETGTWDFNGVTGIIDVDFGVNFGSLALDDTTAWHFDYTTTVAPGKFDLYSVALHEMVHVLGIGASQTWKSLVSGTTWNGSEVIDLVGSGANLIDPSQDQSHIAHFTMSQRITDGEPQEVAMDRDIGTGERNYLTVLDLAFLRDIGYSTIMPTFSDLAGDFDSDGDVDSSDLGKWQAAFASTAGGDADGDGDADGADFLIWQRYFTGAMLTPAVASVPEPSSLVLFVMAAWLPASRGFKAFR